MSKEALNLLAKEIDSNQSVSSAQVLELGTVAYVASQLHQEISVAEPALLKEGLINGSDLTAAATTLRNYFLAKVRTDSILDRTSGIVAYNAGNLQVLRDANRAAFLLLEKIVVSKGGKIVGLKSSLTSADHVRTDTELTFSQSFYDKLANPVQALRVLKEHGNLVASTQSSTIEKYTEVESYYSGDQKIFDIRVGASSKVKATSSVQTDEKLKASVMKALNKINWAEQEGSDSFKDALFKEINNILVKTGATGKLQSPNKTRSTAKRVTKQKATSVKYKPTGVKKVTSKKPLINLQAIVNYINGRLPEAIRRNMGPGSLVNRSGRFSNSAKIVDARLTPQGFPSLGYDYLRSPYDVFDPYLGKLPWNIPSRNPRTLIEKSVRDVAKDLAIGRFYLRRV